MSNVLWLGGGCGAGKTTLATRLAHRFDLRLYRVDLHAYPQLERMNPVQHPENHRLGRLDYVARHVTPSAEELARDFLACSTERFQLVVDDLIRLTKDVTAIVEGPGLLPELIAPLVATRGHALFLIPDGDFTDANLRARPQARPISGSIVEQGHRKRTARDRILTRRIADTATAHDLTTFAVDGSLTLDQTGEVLADHFAAAIAAGAPATGATRTGIREDENREVTTAWRHHAAFLGDRAPEVEPTLTYACECPTSGCEATLDLTAAEYDAAQRRRAH